MTPDVMESLDLPPLTARHRTIAFTSGKGGVGKSSLVLNTGLVLARHGRRVVILDGDLGLANLTVLLGQAPRHDIRDVLAGERSLADIAVTGPEGLRVIPAGPGVAELAMLGEAERETLLLQLDTLVPTVDFLLIDTGAGVGDTVLTLIAASDEAVVVTRPEPTALADAYALMKVIIQQDPTYPFHLLINMVRSAEQGQQIFGSLAEILGKFLGYRPGYAGHVVEDSTVSQAVVQQTPFTRLAPRAPATRCVEALAAQLLGTVRRPRTREGFWERLAPRRWGQG
jgi:flagellar biosynthesis protein FlhG